MVLQYLPFFVDTFMILSYIIITNCIIIRNQLAHVLLQTKIIRTLQFYIILLCEFVNKIFNKPDERNRECQQENMECGPYPLTSYPPGPLNPIGPTHGLAFCLSPPYHHLPPLFLLTLSHQIFEPHTVPSTPTHPKPTNHSKHSPLSHSHMLGLTNFKQLIKYQIYNKK